MFIGVSLGLMFIMAYFHESVHQIIYADYGIESHIEWFSHFPDVVTVTEPINSTQCPVSCDFAHEMNEAIGYQLIPIFFLLIFGLFIIIMLIERFVNNTENFLLEVVNLLDKQDGTQKEN